MYSVHVCITVIDLCPLKTYASYTSCFKQSAILSLTITSDRMNQLYQCWKYFSWDQPSKRAIPAQDKRYKHKNTQEYFISGCKSNC
jgi:hypothetical protein